MTRIRADGKVDYSPGALYLDYDQLVFTRKTLTWKIAEGTNSLSFTQGLFNCKGVMDVRDLVVTIK